MAARRIAKSAIDWAALAERVPPEQKSQFVAFKTKSDVYMRAVLANPETPPKIDWEHYKKVVPVAGLVDSFQKQYDALKVPYPADTLSAQIDAQAKEMKSEVEAFKKESQQRIAEHQKEIERIKALLPYNQMTLEDYRNSYPDLAMDPINRPTFWPHFPEDQIGYEEKAGIAPPPKEEH